MSRSCEFLDESLDLLLRVRDRALADVEAPDRASRLVEVFEAEARLWSRYYERTRSRPLWRAALAAEAWARHNAAVWRAHLDAADTGESTRCGNRSSSFVVAPHASVPVGV